MATKTMTVAGLNELEEGVRTAFARGIHARRAKDGAITVYLRRKLDGKTIDTKITTLAEVTRKSVDAAISAAEAARAVKPEPVRVKAAPAVATPDKLGQRSTLQEAWEHWIADIEATKFWSETNVALNKRRINAHCAKWHCWTKAVADLTVEDIARPLLALRNASPHTAKKIKDLVAGILRHAEVKGVAFTDPIPAVKKQYQHNFKAPAKVHFDALLDVKELRELVEAIKGANGDASVRNAMLLQAMVAQRTGEVIGARWAEFKLDAKEPTWTIPRSRMKITDASRGDHVLRLPPAVVSWLKTLPRHRSGLVFPNRAGDGHVSSEAISKAMREGLGQRDRHVPHGWRSSMATLARGAVDKDGRPLFAESWIEGLLDHLTGNQIKDAYLRARDVEGIGRVLAWWAGQIGA